MKRNVVSVVAVLALAGSVFACDKAAKLVAGKPCCGSKAAAAKLTGDQPQCTKVRTASVVEETMGQLPHMLYVVGDLETPCAATAKAKAGADGTVHFKVADKTYDNKTAAVIALAEMLEKEAATMTTVSYAVGKQCYGCPTMAGAMAKQAGQPMTYRLAGMDFNCPTKAEAVSKQIAAALKDGDAAGKPCCASKSKAVETKTADAKVPPCCAGKAKTAGAEKVADGEKVAEAAASDGFDCCNEAQERLVKAQDRIRVIVQVAAEALADQPS